MRGMRYPLRMGFRERPLRGVDINSANDSNGSNAAIPYPR